MDFKKSVDMVDPPLAVLPPPPSGRGLKRATLQNGSEVSTALKLYRHLNPSAKSSIMGMLSSRPDLLRHMVQYTSQQPCSTTSPLSPPCSTPTASISTLSISSPMANKSSTHLQPPTVSRPPPVSLPSQQSSTKTTPQHWVLLTPSMNTEQ